MFLHFEILVLFVSLATIEARRNSPKITLSDGTIRGHIVDTPVGVPVQEYRGIPYAQPPVGNLRYADPKPVKRWRGVKNTQKYGASCQQLLDLTFGNFSGSNMWNAPNAMSEDCLFLNVWTPHPRPKAATVIVWIFGGGFYSGTTALAVYDGKTLPAFTNVIVVSMNYRVGSLGFLATGDGRIKGNFGLKDQQLALKWVHDNIKKFGGNPHDVTIMGESAGAASVGYHMMSPGSAEFFHRGIMQSGSPGAHWAYMSKRQAKSRSDKLFKALNCANDENVLDCLRKPSLNATYIVNNEWVDVNFLVFPWAPNVDGKFLLKSPSNLIRKQKFKKVDLLIGTNKDEGTFWILYAVPTYSKDNASVQNWDETLKALKITEYDLPGAIKQPLIHLYTMGEGTTNSSANRNVVDDIVGDRSFICPTMHFAQASVGFQDKKTYVYHLEQRASNEVWPKWMGVIHGADIQYVFGIPLNKNLGYSENDIRLSKEIMTYWSNFAKFGSPNRKRDRLTRWPKYTLRERYIDFLPAVDTKVRSRLRQPYCDFWSVVQALRFP